MDTVKTKEDSLLREESAKLGKVQTSLFNDPTVKSIKTEKATPKDIKKARNKAIPRPGTDLFGKAMLKEAIQILPKLPDTESLNTIRSFLKANLHFNSEQTRQRNTNYIISRMFPEGHADWPMRIFAKSFPNKQELRDVCFYRFLKAEPLEIQVIEDLLFSNMATGSLSRSLIRKYLAEKFPTSRSINYCSRAVVEAIGAAGVAKVNREKISFSYRDILIPAFAFIIYSEFPEPGMYDIRKVEENRIIRSMLWNPAQILPGLYELRNRGIISKVSEIDNIRQFTTKYTLGQVVDQLVAGVTQK